MKVKVAEATGPVLDFLVGICEGRVPGVYGGVVRASAHPDFPQSPPMFGPELHYSTDWAQGGPIIEREKISVLDTGDASKWEARVWNGAALNFRCLYGPTPLIAAMRCYVASKLGDEVEVPNALETA